jgi:uncharacterized protein YozE (UPF0346 family)
MAKLVFKKCVIYDSSHKEAYGDNAHYLIITGNNKAIIQRSNNISDIKLYNIPKRLKDAKNVAQFIEDNYPTLTLEQLDNIEEVYLRSKEK